MIQKADYHQEGQRVIRAARSDAKQAVSTVIRQRRHEIVQNME